MPRRAIALLLIAGACGSEPSVSPSASPPSPSPSITPSPSPSLAPAARSRRVGARITLLRAEGATVDVNVLEIADPAPSTDAAPAGRRLVAARIELSNPAGPSYEERPYIAAWLVDEAGAGHPASPRYRISNRMPESFTLRTGAFERGFVVFDIPSTARVVAIRFRPERATAPEDGEWTR